LQAPLWEGWITAVFRTSLQFIGPNKTLMHLHGGPLLLSPFSLRANRSLADCLQHGRFATGMAVIKQGSRIEIGGHLSLALDSMCYYRSPNPAAQGVDPPGLSLGWHTLRRCGRAGGLSLITGAGDMLDRLRWGLANHDHGLVLASSQQLIGLGPGLTPSGDDVLVGCLKGLWLRGGSDHHAYTASAVLRHALLPTLHERTTPVGAAFIQHALHGQFAEVVDRAAAALLTPTDPQAVTCAMGQLLAQGETSGIDTALGLLLCLEALLNSRAGARSGAPWDLSPLRTALATRHEPG
jgi:hypothetical protein